MPLIRLLAQKTTGKDPAKGRKFNLQQLRALNGFCISASIQKNSGSGESSSDVVPSDLPQHKKLILTLFFLKH